jgi:DNA-binding PadR family transcriptional regulator
MRRPAATEPRALTDFEQILLGLIGVEPRSGYELKRFFRTTPAAVYHPSDGALYPALRRLEERGYLRAEVAMSGRRGRRVYRATEQGCATTRRWVREPVDPASVGQDIGLHLVRFVLMEGVLSSSEVEAFLADLAAALEGFLNGMEHYLASTPLPRRHPRLALEHGVTVHQASLTWARSAMATLAEAPEPAKREAPRQAQSALRRAEQPR